VRWARGAWNYRKRDPQVRRGATQWRTELFTDSPEEQRARRTRRSKSASCSSPKNSAVLFYGVVSDSTEEAVDLFTTGEEAERSSRRGIETSLTRLTVKRRGLRTVRVILLLEERRGMKKLIATLVLVALVFAGSAQANVKLGATIRGGPQVGSPNHGLTKAAERARVEQMLGRKLAVERIFVPGGGMFPSSYALDSARGGRIPLLSFAAPDTMTWRRVANGGWDSELRDRFRKLVANYPLMLRAILIYETEPDVLVQQYKGTPRAYRAAYRHIHSLAQKVGVTNRWATAISGYTWWPQSGRHPGDYYLDFVTYVGADIYGSQVTTCDTSYWSAFRTKTARAYRWIVAKGKKMIIPELGQRENMNDPYAKARWLVGMRAMVKTEFPEIAIITWSHSDFGGPCSYPRTWWIDTSSRSLSAFRAMALDPYFN
jgi:hypothetical protein